MSSEKKNQDKRPSKEALLKSIADTLLKKRQEKKISVEEASSTLKIRTTFITSMEKGRWDDLPPGVYLKSFLKKYAAFLGLKADDLIDPYFAEAKKEERVEEKKEEASTETNDKASRNVWISASVGAILLLGFVKFVLHEPDQMSPAADLPAQQEVAPIVEEETPLIQEKPAPQQHEISIYTVNPLWMRIDAENRAFEGFIPVGSTWTWTGAGGFQIRMGHGKEVTMLFDGSLIPLGENQKSLSLPNEG